MRQSLNHSLPAALLLGALCTAAGCATLATQAPSSGATLAGNWQLDARSSDDFDRKLGPLLEIQRHRMQPRRGAMGSGATRRGGGGGEGDEGGGAEGREIDVLTMPPEEPDKVRARLADDLRPPAALRIGIDGEALEITAEGEPTRRYQPGQDISRLDTSGALTVASGWDQRAFVIRARYTNKSTRIWHYEIEPATGMLRLNFEANDAEFGKLTLQTHYRRAAAKP